MAPTRFEVWDGLRSDAEWPHSVRLERFERDGYARVRLELVHYQLGGGTRVELSHARLLELTAGQAGQLAGWLLAAQLTDSQCDRLASWLEHERGRGHILGRLLPVVLGLVLIALALTAPHVSIGYRVWSAAFGVFAIVSGALVKLAPRGPRGPYRWE